MRQQFAFLCAVLVAVSATAGSAQWPNQPMPGLPRLPDGRPNLSAPAPRLANGRPDLSGLWNSECAYATSNCWNESLFFDLAKGIKPPEMTPWAARIQAQREARDHVDDPLGYCLPPGSPRIIFYRPFRILPTASITAFLHETDVGPMFRQVFTDGRSLPTAAEPTWLGYSVGRWSLDTFIVETEGFRDGGWLDTRKARPHSDALHVTEQYLRRDFGHIDLTITIDDPKAFVKPWTINTTLTLAPDTELMEAFCDSHAKTMEHRRIDPAPVEPPSGR